MARKKTNALTGPQQRDYNAMRECGDVQVRAWSHGYRGNRIYRSRWINGNSSYHWNGANNIRAPQFAMLRRLEEKGYVHCAEARNSFPRTWRFTTLMPIPLPPPIAFGSLFAQERLH